MISQFHSAAPASAVATAVPNYDYSFGNHGSEDKGHRRWPASEGSGSPSFNSLSPQGGSGDSAHNILRTVKEQEAQFERLTRELEAERQSVVNQLEKFKLAGSETTSASSLSSGTDVSLHWRHAGEQPAGDHGDDADFQDRGDLNSSRLIDTCLRELEERGIMRSHDQLLPNGELVSEKLTNGFGHQGANSTNGTGTHRQPALSSSQLSLNRHQQLQHQVSPLSKSYNDSAKDNYASYKQLMNNYVLEGNADPAANSYSSDFFYVTKEPQSYGREGNSPATRSPISQFTGSMRGPDYMNSHAAVSQESPYADIRRNGAGGNRDYANVSDAFLPRPESARYEEWHDGNGHGNNFRDDQPWNGDMSELYNSHQPQQEWRDDSAWAHPRHKDNYGAQAGVTGSYPTEHGDYGGAAAAEGNDDAASLNGRHLVQHHPWQATQQLPEFSHPGHLFKDNGFAASPWSPFSDDGEPLQYAWPAGDEQPATQHRGHSGTPVLPESEWRPMSRGSQQELPAVYRGASALPEGEWRLRSSGSQHVQEQHLDYEDSLLYARDVAPSHHTRTPSLAGSDGFGPPGYGRSTDAAHQQVPQNLYGVSMQSLNSHGRELQFSNSPELNDVIDCLEHPNDAVKANAAAYLQHLCFKNNTTKAKTRSLGAIAALVKMLDCTIPEVQRHACGCLLNLSHGRENEDGKKDILRYTGLEKLVRLLRNSPDSDVRELITGILWNMSSCKDLKRPIIDSALTILVNEVIIPQSGIERRGAGSERQETDVVHWSSVFRNASGVLRNVSSDGYYARKRLREFRGLVEALIYIVKAAIGKNDMDNKSVENCVCVLRNLSYRLMEVDYPDHYSGSMPGTARNQKAPSDLLPGCFATSGRKAQSNSEKTAYHSRTTAGAGRGELLWQPDMVNVYLPLLADCSNPDTLEAAGGAVQNLAACEWQPSVEFREKVRKEKGLPVIVELLGLEADNVVCASAIALRNLAIDHRNKELIGKYAMQQLVSRLPPVAGSEPEFRVSEQTVRAVMATLHEVVKDAVDHAGALASDSDGIARLMVVAQSRGRFESKTLRCTHQLLSVLWAFAELRGLYKSKGWKEADFISKTMHPRSGNASPAPSSAASTLTRSHHTPSAFNTGDVAGLAANARAASLSRNNLGFVNDNVRTTTLLRNNLGFADDSADEFPREYEPSKPAHVNMPSYNGFTVDTADKRDFQGYPSGAASNDYVHYPPYVPPAAGSSMFHSRQELDMLASSKSASPLQLRHQPPVAIEDEPLYARLAKKSKQPTPLGGSLSGSGLLFSLGYRSPQYGNSSSALNDLHDLSGGSRFGQILPDSSGDAPSSAAIDSWV